MTREEEIHLRNMMHVDGYEHYRNQKASVGIHPNHPYAANPGTMSTGQMQNIIDLQAAKIESLEKVVSKFNLITDKANE